jgi:Zn-dependent protease with chaperone function
LSLVSAAVLAAAVAAGAGLVVAAAAIVAAGTFARPGTRYAILAAAFVLIALIGPGALALALLRPAARVLGIDGGAAFAGPLLIGAAALALALLAELALDMARLRAIKHAARPIGAVPVRRARVAVSAAVATPTAIGYLRPAIVVPAGFRRRVDAAEWEAVIAHEAAHLTRGDDWAKAAQTAVLRLAWWLPGLWILSGRLDVERELASDERAVRTTGVRRYAACLLRLATTDAPASLAPSLWGRRTQVAIRVERLLRPVPPVSALARAATLGAATAATLAVLAAALFAVPPLGRPTAHALRIAVARPALPLASPAPRRAAPTVVGLAAKTGAARIAPLHRV